MVYEYIQASKVVMWTRTALNPKPRNLEPQDLGFSELPVEETLRAKSFGFRFLYMGFGTFGCLLLLVSELELGLDFSIKQEAPNPPQLQLYKLRRFRVFSPRSSAVFLVGRG